MAGWADFSGEIQGDHKLSLNIQLCTLYNYPYIVQLSVYMTIVQYIHPKYMMQYLLKAMYN